MPKKKQQLWISRYSNYSSRFDIFNHGLEAQVLPLRMLRLQLPLQGLALEAQHLPLKPWENVVNHSQMLHVWNIYLHLGDFWGKCW